MTKSANSAVAVAFAAFTTVQALALGIANAAVSTGDHAGNTAAEVTRALEQQGYEVRKIETDDRYLEAYALLNGVRFEIYIDRETGKIVKIEQDD